MRRAALGLARGAVALALAAGAPAQDAGWPVIEPRPPQGTEHLAPGQATAEILARALRTWRRSGTFDDLEAALHAAARHHAGALELLDLGRSRGGRPLIAVRLERPASLEEGTLLCVVPDLEADAREAARGTLDVLVRLLTELEGDGDLVREQGWILVPAPEPDRLDGASAQDGGDVGDASPTVHSGRNFPSGWDPWSAEPPGPYPLSEPETRALADLLLGERRLAAAVLVGDEGTAGAGGVGGGAPAGSLRRFCEDHLGLAVTPIVVPEGDAARSRGLGLALVEAVQAAPELVLAPPRLERVAPRLWTLEVDVALRAPRTERGAPPERALSLTVGGALPLAASAGAVGRGLRRVRLGDGPLRLAGPGRAGPRRVRLLLEADAGATALVRLSTDRARGARLEVPLGDRPQAR